MLAEDDDGDGKEVHIAFAHYRARASVTYWEGKDNWKDTDRLKLYYADLEDARGAMGVDNVNRAQMVKIVGGMVVKSLTSGLDYVEEAELVG